MASSRQLAAIMFTDIVGYTLLMGSNEQEAFNLLKINRSIQQPLINDYEGKCIKEIGDGILASFGTGTDAVLCAIAMQQACHTIPNLKLRIGIHLGEVVFENNDVFGDGVNIASRLQVVAPIGGICISEAVQHNIANKEGIKTAFINDELLKNVKDPVRIYEVVIDYDGAQKPVQKHSNNNYSHNGNEKSIAVLPFVNMSNDPEQEYFSDGMAEEILNALAHLKDLKVAGRTSSFQFKNKNIDLREIGEKLGVHTVLEGSVRKQANKLRVTAQLINVESGFHLWSERYDREMDDIFAIQDEIATAITERLKITFSDNDRTIVSKTITENSASNELYLKGRFYLNRRGSYILMSIGFFEQAIGIDPQFALAYTGLADAYLLSALFSFMPAREAMPKAKAAADAAIAINANLCEPYASLGFYYEFYEWNWKKAKDNFLRSLEINPGYAQGHSWYANFYLCWVEGKFEEALQQGELALKKEPLCAIISGIQASVYYTAQRYEEALAISRSAIELDPNSYVGWRFCGLSLSSLGKHKEAIETLRQVVNNTNRYQIAVEDLILAYVRDGAINEATSLFDELESRYNKEYIAPAYLGIAASWLGKTELSLHYLEKAVEEKDATAILLNYYPNVPATLKEEERFKKIMATINFPHNTTAFVH